MTPPPFVGAKHQGERHSACGEPCCDALLLPQRKLGLSGFVICDGAGGTAAIAHGAAIGARAAWRALLAVRRQLRRSPLRPPARTLLQQSFRSTFLHARRGAPLINHTVLACLWDRQRLLVAQVGDSTLLLRRAGTWALPMPPAKGEFANETTFLRANTPAAAIDLWWTPAQQIEAVIGFSDGLEAAFLAPKPGAADVLQVNSPLAELVIQEHQRRHGWGRYPDWLATSLADEGIKQLSDDDRTLVIASR